MSKCIKNEIVVIHQHHCNFDRERKTREGIRTVGVIGTRDAFPMLPPELKPELAKRGIELLEFCKFFTRKDIVDFYKQIDVQIVWRPYKKLLSNPLKIVNAASFGIPTIAFDELAFQRELGGYYLPVDSLVGFLEALDGLVASPNMYFDYSERCFAKAEAYHIEKIGQLYKSLDI